MGVRDRVRKAFSAFMNLEATPNVDYSVGAVSYTVASPSTPRRRISNERSIIGSIYTRISIDVASVMFKHVKLNDSGQYEDDVESNFNQCLSFEPNLDQGPRQFRQDICMTLFDKGVAAIVAVDTDVNPSSNEIFDIYSLRVGEVVNWYPSQVKVSIWNEEKGRRQEVILDKRVTAIVENPLYTVMNEPNSTLQRLIRKLSLLDSVDEASSSGKLDLIIQLPYTIKSEARRQQAEQRRKDIEFQLKGSTYGIAYTDGTEKITQLNRPTENGLLKQIEYLVELLYAQLGITKDVMDGTADEKTMINYRNRTIEPIVDSVVEAMQRSFIGQIRYKKKERLLYFINPFKLVPISDLAEVGDKFTRNEVLSSNEIRGFIGIPPSKDPKANELRNSNMPVSDTGGPVPDGTAPTAPAGPTVDDMDAIVNEVLDGVEKQVDDLTAQVGNG